MVYELIIQSIKNQLFKIFLYTKNFIIMGHSYLNRISNESSGNLYSQETIIEYASDSVNLDIP